MGKLTAKQARFVDEYLIDLNASQAAIRSGYSAKTAEWIGPQLLKKTHVSEAITYAQEARKKRTEISQDAVIADLRAIAQDAMRSAVDAQGNDNMANHGAAIKATELIGKHIGMWPNKVTHDVGDSIGERLERAMSIIFSE